ncbi:group II intron maturase-specific domain-containing protein [Rhodococcus koreensis]|uniref:group II intron maturase-specific domain-containing protein n=1 Tax=Rhodococcus koreensis TaxID=99653 RepID=UPI00157FB7DA|nr:group II intron maturase-specific domain-containing protein [Rhodococcus koreensis]
MARVRGLTKGARHHGLADLLGRLNPVLQWCAYFRHGVSKATLGLPRCLRLASGHPWLLKLHKRITRGRNSTDDS